MIETLAIANYRSIRELVVELGSLTLVTGANGVGKSNLYRGLRLLSEVAHGQAVTALALEGGLSSVLWAGPETISKSVRSGEHPIQGGPRKEVIALRLGFAMDDFSYAVDLGIPVPVPRTLFGQDPEIKREAIWYGGRFSPQRCLVDRTSAVVRARDEAGGWQVIDSQLTTFDSMLLRVAHQGVPEALHVREQLRSWRFYDHFRCDAHAPARQAHVGVRTPVLSNDGHDLAAAWRTIEEIGDEDALAVALNDAFPGARVFVEQQNGIFQFHFEQPGLLRPLGLAELSDGTLRYLLLVAALLTPRPPPLMVLNEPETSLHPDLLAPLARLMRRYAERNQLWVVSHATHLNSLLTDDPSTQHLHLDKEFGETFVHDQDMLTTPSWSWPKR